MRHFSRQLVLLLALSAACGSDGRERAAPATQDSGPGPAAARPTDTAADDDTASGRADWTAGVTEQEGGADAAVAISKLIEVRSALHEGYERLVFEFDAGLPGYRIEYVDRPVRQCGSGNVVELPGDAWLSLRLFPAHAHTDAGAPTVTDRDRTYRGRNLKRLKLICDFEAVVEWVAAVGRPDRYRVLELTAPARLVVDIGAPSEP